MLARSCAFLLCFVLGLLAAPSLHAQTYPSQTITIVVGSQPGGPLPNS